MKTDGDVEAGRAGSAQSLLLALLVVIVGLVSVWTPLAFPRIAERWFTLPDFLWLAPVPLATRCWRRRLLDRACDAAARCSPSLGAVAIFLLAYVGLVLSNVPYLVPPSIDRMGRGGLDPRRRRFMLVGVLVLLPVILGYTVFNYWVFRGKVRSGEGYH